LGISINPVDYAYQNLLVMMDRSKTALGLCKQKSLDANLGREANDFVQVFSDFLHPFHGKVNTQSFAEMSDKDRGAIGRWLDAICGERIQRPPIQYTTIDLKPKDRVPNLFPDSSRERLQTWQVRLHHYTAREYFGLGGEWLFHFRWSPLRQMQS
jgi:hypothetical protein